MLELILELIELVTRGVPGLAADEFERNRDLVDVTAFRLAHIGEAAKKLSEDVRSRHSGLRWRAMYDMRNVLSHDYPAIMPTRLWKTATEDLSALDQVCREELERLQP